MANEPEDKTRDDGTVRRQHYGAGKQPWDTIVQLGWGPTFAAANVIKYLRRTKETEHSLESARWYYERLRNDDLGDYPDHQKIVLKELLRELTNDERYRLLGDKVP